MHTHSSLTRRSFPQLVGLIGSPIQWNLVLENVFSSKVSGVQCILESSNGVTHSYEIQQGEPIYKGASTVGNTPLLDNDHHARHSILLTDHTGLCQNRSVEYRLTLIPTATFYEAFSTANPTVAWIGAVLVIAFTSLLFSIYDFFVRKDMRDKRTIIQANRTFLRFVSHEVRTPLNTVSMGLKVMCDDVRDMAVVPRPHTDDDDATKMTTTTRGHTTNGTRVTEGTNGRSPPMQQQQQAHNDNDNTDAMVCVPRNKMDRLLALASDINVSAESAVEILSDVLSYDKIEHGNLQLELTTFSVCDLLLRILAEFQVPARAKNITLTWKCGDSNDHDTEAASSLHQVLVVADEVRLAQVLRNLLSNALKFTPEGGSIRAELQRVANNRNRSNAGLRRDHSKNSLDGSRSRNDPFFGCRRVGEIKLSLKDSGVGMTHSQAQSAFGQGVQFDANVLQDGKGSGLGLYIAKGIVEQHGGTLSAASDGVNHGSTVTMVLPAFDTTTCTESTAATGTVRVKENTPRPRRHQVEQEERTEKLDLSEAGESPASLHKLRALVVDDAPMNRKLLSRLLEKRGWTCDSAEDGKVCLDMVTVAMDQEAPYDCILLDYEMPVMNGPETAKHLRAIGCNSCVVGVTGNVLPDDVSYFVSCGVASVFYKPVNLDELDAFWRDNGVLPKKDGNREESFV